MRLRSSLFTIACAALAAGLLAFAPTADPDTWWHVATGRAALAARSTLPIDPFSFSFAGAPWRYKDLAADVLLATLFAAARFAGLWAFAVAVAAGLAAAWRRRAERALPVLLALAVTLPLLPWAIRPNLGSFVLFAWLLLLLERRRFGGAVVLSWLWMLWHRAALLGYVLIAGRALQLVIAGWCARWPRLAPIVGPPPSRRERLVAVGAALGAPLLGLANPSGAQAFVSAVDVAGSDMLRRYIGEWKQLGVAALAGWHGALAAVAWLLVLVHLVLAVRRRAPASSPASPPTASEPSGAPGSSVSPRPRVTPVTIDAWHGGLLLLLALLATRSVRWLPFLALASGSVLVPLLDAPARRLRRAGLATAAAAALLVALAFAARAGVPFALGEDVTVEPTGAVAFARAHRLAGPLLHSYEFGGYLLWQGFPVLVDGRLDQVYPPAFVATCIQAERNPAELAPLPLAGVDWAIGSNGANRFTHQYLFRDPAWAELYYSDAASVYVRRAAHPELAPLAFAVIDPAAPERSAALAVQSGDGARIAAARAELGRMLAESPASLRANSALAIYFHLLGRVAERDTVMGVLRAVAGDHPAVRELGRRFSPATP